MSAITEGLLNLTYPRLFDADHRQSGHKAVISCVANEYHQVGGKMVADMFEIHGWDTHFLGANTPVDHMLEHIHETKPDLVGLSLSIYFNLAALKTVIEAVRANFSNLDLFVGGQAFRWGGVPMIRRYTSTEYVPSLTDLEEAIKET